MRPPRRQGPATAPATRSARPTVGGSRNVRVGTASWPWWLLASVITGRSCVIEIGGGFGSSGGSRPTTGQPGQCGQLVQVDDRKGELQLGVETLLTVGLSAQQPLFEYDPAGRDAVGREHPHRNVVRRQPQPVTNGVGQLLDVRRVARAHHRLQLRLGVEQQGESFPAHRQAGGDVPERFAEDHLERLILRRVPDRLDDVVQPSLADRGYALRLAREVVGERPARDPHPLGDRRDRHRVVPLGERQIERRLRKCTAGRVLLALTEPGRPRWYRASPSAVGRAHHGTRVSGKLPIVQSCPMRIRCAADRGIRVTVITGPIMVSIEPLVRAAGPGIHAHGRPATTAPTTTAPTTTAPTTTAPTTEPTTEPTYRGVLPDEVQPQRP